MSLEGVLFQAIPLVLRALTLAVALLLWWQVDCLVNLSTAHTPRIWRLAMVAQHVSLSVLVLWLVSA